MMNKMQNKKQCISPISLPQNSQRYRFDFQNTCKLNIEQINKNLNSSISPKHHQSSTNRFKQYLNSYKTQSPSNTNKFAMLIPQIYQSPKTQTTNSHYQNQNLSFQQKNNTLKIENSTQQSSSSFDHNQINKQLIYKNKKNNTLEESNLKNDSDSEEEEEVSIWEENQLKTSGIDTDQFVDNRGEQLDFYQIYRLRSALYQQTYVSRLDTIQEVQILSQHFNKEISIEQLQQQQSYLDKYYNIQKKDQTRKSNQNILSLNKNLKDFSQKCQTERQRSKSSYQKNQITSTTLKQQINKQKISNKINYNQKEQFQNYSEKIERDLQNKEHNKQINQQGKEESKQSQLSQQQQINQYKSKRRLKISIDQEEAKKYIQKKVIPIKQISLLDDEDDKDNHESPKNNQSCNLSQQYNYTLNTSKEYTQNTNISKINLKEINAKFENEQIKQNASQPAKAVLSYLQKIVSSQVNFRNQYQQNNKLDQLINKSMGQSSSKKELFFRQQY